MGSVFVSAIGFVVLLMAAQRIVAFVPVLGWLLTTFPITWALWAWGASRLVSRGKEHLAQAENPKMSALGWGIALGAVAGLASAAFQTIIGLIIAAPAAAVVGTGGDPVSSAAAGAGLAGSLIAVSGMMAFITRPIFGMLVTGLAALLFAGGIQKRHA